MNTKTLVRDFASSTQPNLLLLNEKSHSWRLNFNQETINATEKTPKQSVCDFVPQSWQGDVICEDEPQKAAFIPLLKEIGMLEDKIKLLTDE